jgi:hypothetical protein
MKYLLAIFVTYLPIIVEAQANVSEAKVIKVSVCIGQYSTRCPRPADIVLNCDSSIEELAKQICTFRKADGSSESVPWNYVQSGFAKGNRCDYNTYLVICHP